MTPTGNGFFSGGGLLELGVERGGCEVQQSFEVDPVCCATIRRNHPRRVVMEGDITRTGDEMFLHALRFQALRPTAAYGMENVPGMRKFPVVMEAMTKLPGYYVTVFCPVSAQTWLPQRRDRLIIIGTRRPFNFRPPEQTRAVSLAEILEEEPKVEIPDYVYRRLRGQYRDLPIISDPARGDIAPTCVAHYAKDLSTRLVRDARFPAGVRTYSVREYARLQGVPDTYEFCGTPRQQYRQIGNGVAVPVGEWLGRELHRYFNHHAAA